jgi:hypothetical protein
MHTRIRINPRIMSQRVLREKGLQEIDKNGIVFENMGF